MQNNPYSNVEDEEAVPLASTESPDSIVGDRGEPTTRAPKKRKTGMFLAIIGVVIGAIIVVCMFFFFFYQAMTKTASTSKTVAEDPALAPKVSQGPDLIQFKEKIKKNIAAEEQQRLEDEVEAAKQAAAIKEPLPDLGRFNGQQIDAAQSKGSDKKELSPREIANSRRFEGDVVWMGGGSSAQANSADNSDSQSRLSSARAAAQERLKYAQSLGQSGGGASTGGKADYSDDSSSESISNLLKTEKMANGSVSARPDLKFLLINGTTIPCTLIPRIVTDYPATTRCMVNRDVYSANGSILLIAKGSVAKGERKVNLRAGQTMVYVTWSTIESTDGIRIDVDSMAADNLGAAGIKADIHNHYGKRFGGAILLSFLDDVFEAVAKNNSSSEGINFDSSTQNGSDMASIALQQSINIPPTGYVTHATELNIIVARDVDFRSVYGVN